MVTGKSHTSTGLQILDAKVVVFDLVPRTIQFGEDTVFALKFAGENDLLPVYHSPIFFEPAYRHRNEGELYHDIRPHDFMINHKEVVIVLGRVDGFPPSVFQAVLDQKLRFTFYQADRLAVNVGVAIIRLQLVGELDAVFVFADGPFAGVDDIVGLEGTIFLSPLGLRTVPTPMRGKVPPGLASS